MDEFAIVVNIRQIRLVRNGNPFFPFFFSRCFVGFNTFASCTRYSLSLSRCYHANCKKGKIARNYFGNLQCSPFERSVHAFVSIVSNTS